MKTLKIYEKVYGHNHLSTADTSKNIDLVKHKQDEFKEALE